MGILYYVILLSFVVTVVLLWTFMHSPFGLTLKTIRDDPSERGPSASRFGATGGTRASCPDSLPVSGRDVRVPQRSRHAGYGAALVGFRELAFMTVLGGTGWFFGPITGAGAFILIRSQAQQLTEYWHFLMGLVLFLVIVFGARGHLGIGARIRRRIQRWRGRGGER